MIIGVLSDTHDNLSKINKALSVFRERDVELLIHLGDIISPFALLPIIQFPAKTIVVRGNNDGDVLQLRELSAKAGITFREQPYITNIGKHRVIMLHGFGPKETTLEVVEALASTQRYDIVFYGHTHRLDIRYVGRTLVLNPGEVCGYLSGKSTVVILDSETLRWEVIEL